MANWLERTRLHDDLVLTFRGDQGIRARIDRETLITEEEGDMFWGEFTSFSDQQDEADRDPDRINPHSASKRLAELAEYAREKQIPEENLLNYLIVRAWEYTQTGGNPNPSTPRRISDFMSIIYPEQVPAAA